MKVQLIIDDQDITLGDKLSKKEALELAQDLMDAGINFQKVNYLRNWERDHTTKSDQYEKEISRLRKEKVNILDRKYQLNGSETIDFNSNEKKSYAS